MIQQRVFVDANVLRSRTLRDWLFLLRREIEGMFQLHTSEDVMAEVIYTIRRDHPAMSGGFMANLRKKMVTSMDEIVGDFDAGIAYEGRDPNDRHVHAAAVASHAHILLTEDKGFGEDDSTTYEVYGCDDFFTLIDDSAAWFVERVTDDQRKHWQSRPKDKRKSLSEALRAAGCPEFADRIDGHLKTLSGL